MSGGDTFQLVNCADQHLWIIISDPSLNAEHVLFVNITTHDPREDQTVILVVGDHSFIQHRSCVRYSGARVCSDANLETLKSTNLLNLHEPVDPPLLQRLRDGAIDSPRTKVDHRTLLQDQGF